MQRRDLLKVMGVTTAGFFLGQNLFSQHQPYNVPVLNGKEVDPIYRHAADYPSSGTFTHSPIQWEEIRKGLDFNRFIVYRKGQPIDSIAVVKINPEYNDFRMFHDKSRMNVERWQKTICADVVFNSSYYEPDLEPTGVAIIDGKVKGNLHNKKMAGAFLANPTKKTFPRAKIMDLRKERIDYRKGEWLTGVESFPMLLDTEKNPCEYKDKKGNVLSARTKWHANRTVICDDHDDNVIVLTTEGGYFSLYDMGLFLRDSQLNVKHGLNLDGGYESQLAIKTKTFDYVTYGQWETQGEKDISIPLIRIPIPAVLGVFPR